MAEVVVNAILSVALEGLFQKMASGEVLDFIRRKKVDDGLIKKLKITLLPFTKLQDVAEEKQFGDPTVKLWLAELKDAVYDAEDLRDEIATDAARSKMESYEDETGIKKQLVGCFSCVKRPNYNYFKEGMESKLNEILERLELLDGQKHTLGLIQDLVKPRAFQRPLPAATSLPLDKTGVYGRADDQNKVTELLEPTKSATGNQIDVISIVGMGGLGKTTLAQMIFNDERVKSWFDLKAWVCISDKEFDASTVTQDILQEIDVSYDKMHTPNQLLQKSDVSYDKKHTLNQLQLELQQKLSGKKFLFVLDDVWRKNDLEYLTELLNCGAKNSKIVVTTRHDDVASISRDARVHRLQELKPDDCWEILSKSAFGSASPNDYPKLTAIGKKIAEKCKGIPLAAKTLGGLLSRRELCAGEWEKILSNNMWEDAGETLPALRVSYYYLPSHLKRCFAYCSIFPQDYKFKKEELIRLWMAEGLLAYSNENGGMEEEGEEYFNDLVSRSFFQQLSEGESSFVMHDLINGLAKSISGKFFCRLESGGGSCGINAKTRHVTNIAEENDVRKKYETLPRVKSLRTFLTLGTSPWCMVTNAILDDFLVKSRRIRVISLAKYRNITVLPEEIGNLKHLRSLDLSETSIERLPNSVSRLYNLQTLTLHGCHRLVELPKDMEKLINMRYLDIRGTKLARMPKGMDKLEDLRILTDFVIDKANGSRIKELGKLKHLQGSLAISGLQYVVSARDAKDANMKDKKLKNLELIWKDDDRINDVGSVPDTEVLQQLEPHTELMHLMVSSYKGTKFPEWVGLSSFSNLKSLCLMDCKFCLSLPPLGELPCLKSLSISGFSEVEKVDEEFYGKGTKPFGSLESLSFEDMSKWGIWFCSSDEAFSLLQKLRIVGCPKLSKSLPKHLPSLINLELHKCDALQLEEPLPSCGIRDLSLKDMKINDSFLEQMVQHCNHLEKLRMEGCRDPISLPEARLVPTTLKQLSFQNCSGLDYSKIFMYTSLELLNIEGSINDGGEYFPLGSLPNLKRLTIDSWQDLTGIGALASEAPHCNLEYLHIYGDLIRFEIEEGFAAPNLTSLTLMGCKKLKSLPEEMQSLFPSLEVLIIKDCPKVESFPNEGLDLPANLKQIEFSGQNENLIESMMSSKWNLKSLST